MYTANDLPDDIKRNVVLFMFNIDLPNLMCINKEWFAAVNNEITYEMLYKSRCHVALREKLESSWKYTYISSLWGFSETDKHSTVEVKHRGRLVKNGCSYFAKVGLKQRPIKGYTLTVSVKIKNVGGYTLLGAMTSDHLTDESLGFFNWEEASSYVGHYSTCSDVRGLTIGYCDNGYMCRNCAGDFLDGFSVNDIMTLQIDITQPFPENGVEECSDLTFASNTGSSPIEQTGRNLGWARYFKNGVQVGPTFYNIFKEDSEKPYHLIVLMNLMPNGQVELAQVLYSVSKPANEAVFDATTVLLQDEGKKTKRRKKT